MTEDRGMPWWVKVGVDKPETHALTASDLAFTNRPNSDDRGMPWWSEAWRDELDIIRKELTDKEHAVLVEFARFCDGAGKTFVGMQTLAKSVGCDRKVADRAIAKAEALGLVRNHGKHRVPIPGSWPTAWRTTRAYNRSVVLVDDTLSRDEFGAMTDLYDWIRRAGPNYWPSVDGDRDPIPVEVVLDWGEPPF